MIKHILVPTDGSEGALAAARFAGDLASALGAEVTVLAVIADDVLLAGAWGPDPVSGLPPGIEGIRSRIESGTRENDVAPTVDALGAAGKDAKTEVVWGHHASVICTHAERENVDLIVIGSHGRSALGGMLLGSVSHAVANRAPCPVTVVRDNS